MLNVKASVSKITVCEKKTSISYKSCLVQIYSLFRLGSLHSNTGLAHSTNVTQCHVTLRGSNAILAALEKCESGKTNTSRYKTFSMKCSPRVDNGHPFAPRFSLQSWVFWCASDPLHSHAVRTEILTAGD